MYGTSFNCVTDLWRDLTALVEEARDLGHETSAGFLGAIADRILLHAGRVRTAERSAVLSEA